MGGGGGSGGSGERYQIKWKHLKKHVFGAKITQASLQIIKRYVPKKKASIQSYLNFLKVYVGKLERNYIYIDISYTFWQCSLNPQKYVLAPLK